MLKILFHISSRIAAGSGAEVPLEKGHQSSIERQAETPKIELKETTYKSPNKSRNKVPTPNNNNNKNNNNWLL